MCLSPETEGPLSFSSFSLTHIYFVCVWFFFLINIFLIILIWCFFCVIDYRTGESRGFAFVRYKYADEAQKAVERLDGQIYFLKS